MKSKLKPVYYCEHCNRHGLSEGMMRKHEKKCFKNPSRIEPPEDPKQTMDEAKARVKEAKELLEQCINESKF